MMPGIFNQKYKVLVPSSILLLGILIYSNTFYSSFHFDDISSIVDNPAIRHISDLQSIWNFWPARFLTYFSLAVNYHLSQLNVWSYHLFNLAIHLSSTILVWWLTLLTFSAPAMKGQRITGHAKVIAFFAALVFMAHPVQTQGVTYIIQRATSLAALFYLASLCLYVKSRLSGNPAVSAPFYYGSFIAAVMAMFTKETAITLPFAVLLYEACFLRTKKEFSRRYIFPFFAALLIIPLVMVLTGYVDFTGMRRIGVEPPGISSRQYLFTQFRVMVTYLRLLFVPINQNLDYYYPVVKNLLALPALASLLLLVSILAAAIRIFSKYRLISFGIFWFFLTLLPDSSVIPIRDVIFEHRLYLPMVGFSFFLVSLIYYLFEGKALKPMVITLLIITSCCAILTYKRNFIWKDEFTLWNDVVHKSPEKARAYNNRGLAYGNQGKSTQAISDYNKAIAIDPALAEVYNNRALAYNNQGNIKQAIADFNKAIEIRPNYACAYNNRGLTYNNQGDSTRAVSDYNKAIEINPNYADAYYNRGILYNNQGNLKQAVSDYNKAIEINPGYANAYYNRGIIYNNQRDFAQALYDYTRAIEINPNHAEAHNNRGIIYYLLKEYDKAWTDVHKAEQLGCAVNPEFRGELEKASGRDK